MKELLDRALDVARSAGASHAEARVVLLARESYEVKNGAPVAALHSTTEGLGVRAVANGAWGFAALQDLTPGGAALTPGRLKRAIRTRLGVGHPRAAPRHHPCGHRRGNKLYGQRSVL